jgi:cell division septal protein FtsQ
MKKQKFRLAVKPLVISAVIILVLSFAGILLGRAAKNCGLFTIRDIIVREGAVTVSSINLSFLLGRNIFAVDLGEEERNIARLYPGYREIKLIRVFPDRLFALFIRRRPVALVKLYRYFCVDEDAVLFDLSADAATLSAELPVISGLDTKIFGPKAGRKYNARELLLGVKIIKAIRDNRRLAKLRIKNIDVVNPANASFVVLLPVQAEPAGVDIEIRIGQEYIVDKINILASLLVQERRDWSNIKYIDLRFKEPVIKFNDEQK